MCALPSMNAEKHNAVESGQQQADCEILSLHNPTESENEARITVTYINKITQLFCDLDRAQATWPVVLS